jgi:2,4-diketo-3-deoxy-L-fuconate hydrolase
MFSLGNFASGDGRRFAGLVLASQSDGVVTLPERRVEELLPNWDGQRPRLERLAESGEPVPLASLQVLPPVRPDTLLQAAANYRKHVVDLVVATRRTAEPETDLATLRAQTAAMMDEPAASGMPFLFLGRPGSMCGPYDDIVLPPVGVHDWELELGVVMGRKAWHVSASEALEYVAGYVMCNDLTTRDLVSRPEPGVLGADWFRAKNAPTFFPTGPWLVPA